MLKDIIRLRSLLKDVNTIDIVSFGSAISPEYLILLLSEASWNGTYHRKYGFVGASLPGGGWHGGFNELLSHNCVEWVIGGFFGAVRRISSKINTNDVEVHNIPQGVIAKIMSEESRFLHSNIGVNTFIDPDIKGSLINEKLDCSVSPVEKNSEKQLNYSLPENEMVLLRGAGFSNDGAIVMESNCINLDAHDIIRNSQRRKVKIVIQVPDVTIDHKNMLTVDRDVFNEVFISPKELHKITFFNERYLSIDNSSITRNCETTKALSRKLTSRIKEKESLIIGIGLPVSAINNFKINNNYKLDIFVESGNRGGLIVDGDGFGITLGGSDSPLSQVKIFEKIWKGDIDHALLGVGELDRNNNINVAKLGDKFFGVGGFLDITQSIDKITFCTRKKERLRNINSYLCFNAKEKNKDVEVIEAE